MHNRGRYAARDRVLAEAAHFVPELLPDGLGNEVDVATASGVVHELRVHLHPTPLIVADHQTAR